PDGQASRPAGQKLRRTGQPPAADGEPSLPRAEPVVRADLAWCPHRRPHDASASWTAAAVPPAILAKTDRPSESDVRSQRYPPSWRVAMEDRGERRHSAACA